MTAPLGGIRVVEYLQYVARPLCGVLLADLGAEFVKVTTLTAVPAPALGADTDAVLAELGRR